MSILVHYDNQSETIKVDAVFDDYCCTFDEICKVIKNQFHLNNSLTEYRMKYYDRSHSEWINFNIHVSKRINELLRYSLTQTVEIRVKYHPRTTTTTSFIKEGNGKKSDSKTTDDGKYAHMVLWLDEHIGNSLYHKRLKQICQVMINTNTSFLKYDDIDTRIQSDSIDDNNNESISRFNLKYLLEITREYSHSCQCILFIVDNTDEFLHILDISLKLTHSLSLVISGPFAKEILPIIVSRKQKQLLPKVSFLYILCSNIKHYYDWALGYIENENLHIDTNLELFDDEKALFVRLLNDIRRHLTNEGNRLRRDEKVNWKALQYYTASRQLFLNTLPWEDCPTLSELNCLNQLIEETHDEVVKTAIETYFSFTINNNYEESNEKFAEQCAEIFEGT